MALAKYYEDNLEIMFDRLISKEHNKNKVQMRFSYLFEYASETESLSNDQEVQNSKIHAHGHKCEDKFIVCKDCGRVFLFSARSQEYFASKKWRAPKRCKCCREHKNIQRLMTPSF